MKIDTALFKQIVREDKEEKAVEALTEALSQTYRFGCFTREYIRECAKDMLEKYLNEK